MTIDVQLRDVAPDDVELFFEHQLEPEATRMASFPSRDRATFSAKWQQILADPTVVKQTVLCDGAVAGYIVCYEQAGRRLVGYWLGKAFWGKGVATRVLAALLEQVTGRPLYAFVTKDHVASRRVLEKCGFAICGEADDEFLLQLAGA